MDAAELRRRREALGMNQSELARALDVPVQTVARWERGDSDKADRIGIRHPRMLALALRALAQERDADGEQFTADLERALTTFGAADIRVVFRADAPAGRAGLTIAFGPLEFAHKVGLAWERDGVDRTDTGDDDGS